MDEPPSLELPERAMEHLMLVLQQQDDSMRVLKLHLYTEFFLNEAIAAYLRTDKSGIDRIRLHYAQKITFLEVTGLLEKDCSDFLRRLNSLRHKIAHELEYHLTAEDAAYLSEGFGRQIPRISEGVDFRSIAAFLSGYLGGAVSLARRAAQRLTDEENG